MRTEKNFRRLRRIDDEMERLVERVKEGTRANN